MPAYLMWGIHRCNNLKIKEGFREVSGNRRLGSESDSMKKQRSGGDSKTTNFKRNN